MNTRTKRLILSFMAIILFTVVAIIGPPLYDAATGPDRDQYPWLDSVEQICGEPPKLGIRTVLIMQDSRSRAPQPRVVGSFNNCTVQDGQLNVTLRLENRASGLYARSMRFMHPLRPLKITIEQGNRSVSARVNLTQAALGQPLAPTNITVTPISSDTSLMCPGNTTTLHLTAPITHTNTTIDLLAYYDAQRTIPFGGTCTP